MRSVLLLNKGGQVLGTISWQRAFCKLFKGEIEVLEFYEDWAVGTSSRRFKVPAVVQLVRYVVRRFLPVKFSRHNVYARDECRCQYCGRRKPLEDLNLDHVIPRSQGGKTSWKNVVTSCVTCNHRKGGRTPEQAGMALRKVPSRPAWVPALAIEMGSQSIPDAWRSYLYWNQPLEN